MLDSTVTSRVITFALVAWLSTIWCAGCRGATLLVESLGDAGHCRAVAAAGGCTETRTATCDPKQECCFASRRVPSEAPVWMVVAQARPAGPLDGGTGLARTTALEAPERVANRGDTHLRCAVFLI